MAVRGANAANGRHTQRHQIAIRLGAVALKIAVQPPLALGHGQRVAGQRKVVHAHIHIARLLQHLQRLRQHAELVHGVRQVLHGNAALGLKALRQVRVGVEGDAIGPQLANLRHGAGKTGRGLQGQAVDQVHVDGFKTDIARLLHQVKHLLGRLLAVHGLLHSRVKILHPKA